MLWAYWVTAKQYTLEINTIHAVQCARFVPIHNLHISLLSANKATETDALNHSKAALMRRPAMHQVIQGLVHVHVYTCKCN